MKHVHYYIGILLAAVLVVSCGKDFQEDIDKLNATHTSIEQRVSTLETKVAAMNTQLRQLSVLATAVEQGFYITDVHTTDESYELKLNNGQTLVLQLKPDGTLTLMPAISMTQIDGLFYWTLNGQLFTGADGLPVRSTEQAPVMKYDYTLQQWVISIDGGKTFKDINTYISVYINDTVLMQVINNYVTQHTATLFSQQMLYQIVYTYIQQRYDEVFNITVLDNVVKNYVDEHYTRIFNYTLLENVFKQYNYEYVTSNIKVDELVNVMVSFIREHNEIFENNEVLYEIVASYMSVNNTTIFSEELLLSVVNNFIENHQDYVNVQLLTEVINNYLDVHQDTVFNTETTRTLLREYVKKYYVQVFSQNILIQAIATYVTQNSTTIFNQTLISEILNTYVQNNYTTIFSQQAIVEIVNTYIHEHNSTVFDRDVLIGVIADYFSRNYNIYIDRTVIAEAINNYLTVNERTVIDVDMVSNIIRNYITSYSIEVFSYDMLTQVIHNYFSHHEEVIATYVNQGNDVIKNVLIDGELCVITLAEGQVARLVVYDALDTLRYRVQSIVVMPNANGHVTTDIWHKQLDLRCLVSPASMTSVIVDKFKSGEITLEFFVTDANGNVSKQDVKGCNTYNGLLYAYFLWSQSAPKTVALHVKENKIGGTDILTEFTPVDCEGEEPDPDTGGDKTFTITSNNKNVTFKMIKVQPGTFQMGSTSGYSDEKPVHSVTLTKAYYMGETEVTQALWYAVMGRQPGPATSPSWEPAYGFGDNYPAYRTTYEECQQFLTKLNQLTGQQFRFPTEAEWEFAAKGGVKSNGYTYAGSNTIDNVAWYTVNSYDKGKSSPDYGTHQVKTKAANELGLYDMSGNVCEWCYDWYGSYSSSSQTDPTGPTTGSGRVSRGGSWDNYATNCRVANRFNNSPSYRSYDIGLRLAL